jgi:hypothetical protein
MKVSNVLFKFILLDDKDEAAKKKSLRNQFFYQERTSQTFNLPIREKGIKTDPPRTSTFSVETT